MGDHRFPSRDDQGAPDQSWYMCRDLDGKEASKGSAQLLVEIFMLYIEFLGIEDDDHGACPVACNSSWSSALIAAAFAAAAAACVLNLAIFSSRSAAIWALRMGFASARSNIRWFSYR